MSALTITHRDIGRHLFTIPDLDSIRDGLSIDTEVVILFDEGTKAIGYLHIRGRLQAKGEDGVKFGNFSRATVILIDDDCREEFFETQEESIRAALAYERAYADEILRKCKEFERRLPKETKSDE